MCEPRYYILMGKLAIPCDLEIFMGWLQKHDDERSVAVDKIGPYMVSTVFLGLDHSFGGDLPILFETMIFGDMVKQEVLGAWYPMPLIVGHEERCSTWEEAIDMHERGVAVATAKLRQLPVVIQT